MGELNFTPAGAIPTGLMKSKVIGDFTLPAIAANVKWNGTLSESTGNFDAIAVRVFPNPNGKGNILYSIGVNTLGSAFEYMPASGFFVKADNAAFYGFFVRSEDAQKGYQLQAKGCGIGNQLAAQPSAVSGAATGGVRVVVTGIKF